MVQAFGDLRLLRSTRDADAALNTADDSYEAVPCDVLIDARTPALSR
jgi:hypothetical protein